MDLTWQSTAESEDDWVAKKTETQVQMDRRASSERRDTDRRESDQPVEVERRTGERRKVQRRRQIDPTTCERDYTNDEIEFMQALDDYKRASGRMFPTCSEILEVIRGLGYVRPGDELDITEEELVEEAASDEQLDDAEAMEDAETNE